MDEFVIRAGLAGLGLAAIAGPLGAFVVWRRLAFFGDALAHSALLGLALAFLLEIEPILAIAAFGAAFALALSALLGGARLSADTLLSIAAFTTLSLGLIALSFVETLRVDLVSYLFGDVLAVTRRDVGAVWLGAGAALVALAFLWRPLLAASVDEDLARVEGVNVDAVRFAFVLLLALVVALAMKIVGVLLVTALLVIPAAGARRFASSPEAMAAIAAGLGALAVLMGLYASLEFDTPSGPSIVVAAAALFAVSLAFPRRA
ncbi:MAG: metal ABC transporter permease [Tagaea sp.]|nr:metal ABC transporter permease [Tagaea sp.]